VYVSQQLPNIEHGPIPTITTQNKAQIPFEIVNQDIEFLDQEN